MPPLPPVTKVFMLVCTAVFCAQLLLGRWIQDLFALWPLSSGNFMPWQVLSYSFLHGDIGHLFFNMLALYMFGGDVEQLLGSRRYLIYYLLCVIGAAATQLVVMGNIDRPPVPTVGASGGVFGLLLAFGMAFPQRRIILLFPPIPMKARTFVMVFGAIELVMGVLDTGGVAHFAHLGGMVGGYLMIRYWRRQPPFGGSRRR